MPNQDMNNFDPMEYTRQIQTMHPEAYRWMMPYIEHTVTGLQDVHDLTDAQITSMARQAVRNSGIMSRPPHGHNENLLTDIARALIIAGIYSRFWNTPVFCPNCPFPNCPNPWQPCWPYQTFPVFPIFPVFPFRPGFRPGRPVRPGGGRPGGSRPGGGRPGGGRPGGGRPGGGRPGGGRPGGGRPGGGRR